jgi:hypothetical protein
LLNQPNQDFKINLLDRIEVVPATWRRAVDALCELKTRKVLALAMATTEQIELDKNRPYPMKLKSEAGEESWKNKKPPFVF